MPTPNLNLPLIDPSMSADVPRDMNALAHAVDAAVGENGSIALRKDLTAHINDKQKHISQTERDAWNKAVVDIGDKELLVTQSKTDLVSAVNELFQSAGSGKKLVADATTAMGVPTSPTAEFATIAANIRKIQTGRKWATGFGYVGESYEYNTGSAIFPFRPEIIILAKIKNGALMEHAVYVEKSNYYSEPPPNNSNFYTYRDASAPVGKQDQVQFGQVTFIDRGNGYWGWTMRVSTNDIPANCTVTWIAFGPQPI